jgi:hypothetical protein
MAREKTRPSVPHVRCGTVEIVDAFATGCVQAMSVKANRKASTTDRRLW